MVAITVILAAVIAAFVFGLAGTTGSSKNVGLTVTQSGTTGGEVTIQGGTDVNQMNKLEYKLGDGAYTEVSTSSTTTSTTTTFGVGDVLYISGGMTGQRVLIRGSFDDGSTQVLFDKQF